MGVEGTQTKTEPAALLHLVEARLCGELGNGGADLSEHLLRAEVVAFGVVHLDLKPLRANLWEGGAAESVAVLGLQMYIKKPCIKQGRALSHCTALRRGSTTLLTHSMSVAPRANKERAHVRVQLGGACGMISRLHIIRRSVQTTTHLLVMCVSCITSLHDTCTPLAITTRANHGRKPPAQSFRAYTCAHLHLYA